MSRNLSKCTLLRPRRNREIGDQSLQSARSYDAASFLVVVCEMQRVFLLLFARSLFFLDRKFACASVYAVPSCYLRTSQPITDISNAHLSA